MRPILMLAVVAALAGGGRPTTDQPRAENRWRIGFAMTMDDPYWQNMVLGAKDEVKKLGADVTFMNAQEDIQKQAQQINDLIAQGVDAVCLVPMKPDGLINSVRALNAAGVPVIIVNREIGPGCEYVACTGTDTYDGALTSAKILMEAIGGEGAIVEFQQVLGTGPQLLRRRASQEALLNHPGVKLVAQIPHEGNDSKVVAAMGTLLAIRNGWADSIAPKKPQRYGSVIGVHAEKLDEYQTLHAAVWPEILKMIKDPNKVFHQD